MAQKDVDAVERVRNMLEMPGAREGLLGMLSDMLHAVMEAEVTAPCGASYGERSDDRLNQRNGTRQRPFETRMGTVELMIPRLRKESYLRSFVEPRRRWERALVNVVCEAYMHGVSTRKVEELVEAMGARGMSKSEAADFDASVEVLKELAAGTDGQALIDEANNNLELVDVLEGVF